MDKLKGNYRERLYKEYLSTHGIFDFEQIKQELELRKVYFTNLIKRYISKNKDVHILDLGCGYGALLYFLKKAGYYNLKGIDLLEHNTSLAKKLGIDNIESGDVIKILKNTKDLSYDIIVALDFIEHFTKQETMELLDEVFRVLKYNGTLILHVPNGGGIFSGRAYFNDLTHELAFTNLSIKQLLNSSGFINFQIIEDGPLIHGFKSFFRFILWKIFRLFFHLIYITETGDLGRELVLTQNMLVVSKKKKDE